MEISYLTVERQNDAKGVRTMRDLANYCDEWGLQVGETGIPVVDNVLQDEEILTSLKAMGVKPCLMVDVCDEEKNVVNLNAFDEDNFPFIITLPADMQIEALGEHLLTAVGIAVELHHQWREFNVTDEAYAAVAELYKHLNDARKKFGALVDVDTMEWINTLIASVAARKELLGDELTVRDKKINKNIKNLKLGKYGKKL